MRYTLLVGVALAFLSLEAMAGTTGSASGASMKPEKSQVVKEWRSEFNDLARTLSAKPESSYMFLVSFAPEKTISYANGKSLKDSLIALRGEQTGTIGHTMVGWQCSDGRRVVSRGLTALSGGRRGPGGSPETVLRKSGYGLIGPLAIYTDGYLQHGLTGNALTVKFNAVRQRKYPMKWIGVKVSNQACRNAVAFKNRFQSSGAYKKFGFNLDPKTLRGGGCSTYARQVLREAGVLSNTSQYWTRSVTVPYKLIANPGTGIPGNVSLRHLPMSQLSKTPLKDGDLFKRSWRFNQPGLPVVFADTELIYYTILEAERMVRNGDRSKFPRSIQLRDRKVRQSGSGTRTSVKIDRNLDSKTAGIYQSLKNNRLDTYDYTYSKINGVTGLILEGPLK